MKLNNVKTDKFVWYYIEEPDDDTLRFLRSFKFHHLDIEDVLGESQPDKIDHYKKYLFIILRFTEPLIDIKKEIKSKEIIFFLGKNYLITISRQKYTPLEQFFQRFKKNISMQSSKSMGRSTGYLFYKMLDILYRSSRPSLQNLGKQVADVENKIFTDTNNKENLRNLGYLKRNLINLKSMIDSQRFLVTTLVHIKKDFLEDELSIYFDDIHDYLEKNYVVLSNYSEIADSIQKTYDGMLTQRTNDVIKILTVISVSLLPLTLFTGIYGMNVSHLPFDDHPLSVWFLFAILILIICIIILLLKKKKWF